MIKNKFIIASVLFILTAYSMISYLSFKNAVNREGNITCPDQSKSARYVNVFNSSQVLIEFHNFFNPGGANVVSFKKDSLNVTCRWIDNNSLAVYYPKDVSLSMQEDSVMFFSDKVYIQYFPE